MEKSHPSVPLDNLMSTDENMYALTNAAIHRSKQISLTGIGELEPGQGKIVSIAIKEVITREVQYSIQQD